MKSTLIEYVNHIYDVSYWNRMEYVQPIIYIYMYRLPAFFRIVMVTTFKPQVCAKKGMVAAARGLLCNSAGLFSGHGIEVVTMDDPNDWMVTLQ